MSSKLPHIPRIITATVFPTVANVILWAGVAGFVGYNVFLTKTKPMAYSDKIFAIFTRPNSPELHDNLARALWGSGLRTLAKQEFAVAAEFSPVLGAQSSIMDEREADQKKFWQDTAANHPDYRDAYIQLAALSYTQGNLIDTQRYLSQAEALDPNGKATHDLLGFISGELKR